MSYVDFGIFKNIFRIFSNLYNDTSTLDARRTIIKSNGYWSVKVKIQKLYD